MVDTNSLSIDELIFLISEYTAGNDVQAYISKLVQIWQSVRMLHNYTDPTYREAQSSGKVIEGDTENPAKKGTTASRTT